MSGGSKRVVNCLSGWGQKSDSLEIIFDGIGDCYSISSLDYLQFQNVEDFFLSTKIKSFKPEIVIGWSLGGQIALRLIEKKILSPQLLILISTPFQMIKDRMIQSGMSKNVFEEFYKNFSAAPSNAMKKFAILTAMNDRNFSQIAKTLQIDNQHTSGLEFWLKELESFSCFDIDFSLIPRTLCFHGAGDKITHISQANYFKDRIANFRLETLTNCGHAPHLNDPQKIKNIILEEVENLHPPINET